MIRITKQKYYIWMVLILAVVLRLVSLNQSLWLDEATSANVAVMSLPEFFNKFIPADFHPPLYYLFLMGWSRVFGISEISLRIPSVIFGVATVYFVYLIAKKLFDIKTAFIAGVLSATSGLLIYYSQEARMYSLTALLVSMLFYFFLEKKWVAFSLTLAALSMTDYLALLVLPVFLIFAGKDVKKLLVSFVPSLVVFAFWLPTFWSQISAGLGTAGSNWWNILGTLSWKNFGLIPVKFVLGRISFDNSVVYGLLAGTSILIYGGLAGINILRRPLKDSPLKVLLGWLVIPILLGVLISLKVPVLYYFRFLFCLPALYILAAGGIASMTGIYLRLALVAVLAINIFSSGYYLTNTKFQREDWRGIARAVGTDTIVYPSNSQDEALIYYGVGRQVVYFKDFETASERSAEVWLSRYVWEVFDEGDLARIKIEELGYNRVQVLNLNGVEFWKYSK